MNKSTISISRFSSRDKVYITIVDKKNKKSYYIDLSIKEYGFLLSGIVNNNNCRIQERVDK